jgi:predicted LPLAT superfamily acyltransferase
MAAARSEEKGPRGWSSRSIGSSLQHGIFYLLIRLRAGWIVSTLLHAVVGYYVAFRPSVRKRARYYLARRFPGSSVFGRLRKTYLLDLNLGRVLIDRAALGIAGPEVIRVDFGQRGQLRSLLGERKGLVLLTAHVGGWQAAMAALRFLNVPINLLVHREEGDVDLHYFEHRGGPSPFRIIDPAEPMGGMLTMMEVLKKGEVLCVMGDRVFGSGRGTVAVEFLGDPIPLPFGTFKIASVTGSPIAVLFSHRTGRSTYELTLDRVIRVPGGLGRTGAEFAPYAKAFVEGLEAYISAHPFQFFNFFDMWAEVGLPPATETGSTLRKARRIR